MACPGCTLEPTLEVFEGRYGQRVEVDVCHHCNGLWFDGRESLMLSPRSTLELFRSMASRQQAARATLVGDKRCLRCSEGLRETHDMIKGTRYTYFQCEAHGRYLTFFQFLREKGLLRTPTIKELAHLKETVGEVLCSNCGARIPLAKTQVCEHCAAPVSILAKETIEQQVKALNEQVNKPPPDPRLVAAQLAMTKAEVTAEYARQEALDRIQGFGRRRGTGAGFAADLVIDGLVSMLFR